MCHSQHPTCLCPGEAAHNGPAHSRQRRVAIRKVPAQHPLERAGQVRVHAAGKRRQGRSRRPERQHFGRQPLEDGGRRRPAVCRHDRLRQPATAGSERPDPDLQPGSRTERRGVWPRRAPQRVRHRGRPLLEPERTQAGFLPHGPKHGAKLPARADRRERGYGEMAQIPHGRHDEPSGHARHLRSGQPKHGLSENERKACFERGDRGASGFAE